MLKHMKFAAILAGIAVIAVPFAMFANADTASAQISDPWSVEYYNNTNLRGAVAYTTQTNDVGFDWTAGAPAPGVNPDFFSARWTSVQDLQGGTYQISLQADDGVRVLVNNAPLIDEFHTSTATTYTETFQVPAGQHTIQVEYYEGGGVAYLDFELDRLSGARNEPLAIVQAYRLNVRDEPSAITGTVLTQIAQNETYRVLGRTADSSWWQVFANGLTGWVSGSWIDVINAGDVPVTDEETPEITGYSLSATANLNIRSGPGVGYEIVGWLPYLQTAEIIGRYADNSWWQIRYGDVTGWVSGFYTQLPVGVDISEIPVTEGTVQTGALTATANLNVRSGPGIVYDIVEWLPYQERAEVIGRTADNSWWQIRYQGVTGWVSGFYTTLAAGTDLNSIPITG